MRRIATERPATDAVVVRVIMREILIPSGPSMSRALVALGAARRAD